MTPPAPADEDADRNQPAPREHQKEGQVGATLRMRGGRRSLSMGTRIVIQTRRKVPQPEAPLK